MGRGKDNGHDDEDIAKIVINEEFAKAELAKRLQRLSKREQKVVDNAKVRNRKEKG